MSHQQSARTCIARRKLKTTITTILMAETVATIRHHQGSYTEVNHGNEHYNTGPGVIHCLEEGGQQRAEK